MKSRSANDCSIALVACLGLWLLIVAFYHLIDCDTVYSSGYSGNRFNSLRIGMTRQQVETTMGPPLKKTIQEYQGGDEMWAYTDQATITSNYWRRWIIFNKGKIAIIVKDFWVD